jgi:hypothetical protein
MIAFPEENPGRIGERGRRGRQHGAQAVELPALRLVGRMMRLVGAGEMAHHQPKIDALQRLWIGRNRLDFPWRHAEPRHAAVDLQGCRQGMSCGFGGFTPCAKLFGAVEHGDQACSNRIGLRTGRQAVQYIDGGTGTDGGAQCNAFAYMGHEEGIAALLHQGAGDTLRAEPIAVSLDDAGTFRVAEPRLQAAIILTDCAEIDGQDGAGIGRRIGRNGLVSTRNLIHVFHPVFFRK